MPQFTDYPSNPFADLSNTPTTIIEATTNPAWVTSIIICNKGATPFKFYLKKVRTGDDDVTIFLITDLRIEPYQTIDVMRDKIDRIQLEYSSSPDITDSLVCYSDGYTKVFDCDVMYTRLNELPFTW